MYLANPMSIETLVHEYVPAAEVVQTESGLVIFFGLRDMYYNQASINAFWRTCNQYRLKPVAKTLFGKIRAIRLEALS